jgi:uncharacterized protein (DUF302 family)
VWIGRPGEARLGVRNPHLWRARGRPRIVAVHLNAARQAGRLLKRSALPFSSLGSKIVHMQEGAYGLRISLPVPYEEAVRRTTDALKAEGFGVLTTIDVQQTLRVKLNRDFRKYVILGACNPPLADRALHAELEIGLLLPCNVIVYEKSEGESAVAAMAPLSALGIVGDNPDLQEVAKEADQRLRRALTSLERA